MRTIVIIMVCILQCSLLSYAQNGKMNAIDFVPREQVIFIDDFSHNTINSFPASWRLDKCELRETPGKLPSVQKIGDRYAVSIDGRTSAHSAISIEPDIATPDYIPDSFTFEFDVQIYATYFSFGFYEESCQIMGFAVTSFMSPGWIITTHCPKISDKYYKDSLPGFQPEKWHHIAMSYTKEETKCYIDSKQTITMTSCETNPRGLWLHPGADDIVNFTNVRLATGPYAKTLNFNQLLTSDKFVTHAIHFDVNKSSIKPESTDFIKQLATWLKQNPSVKLEIDGHTDSDGDAAANMKLSQDRADEVKKQLVSLGIIDTRLTTKGFGATKPIQPNTTPEGKAENRRVEFIKR